MVSHKYSINRRYSRPHKHQVPNNKGFFSARFLTRKRSMSIKTVAQTKLCAKGGKQARRHCKIPLCGLAPFRLPPRCTAARFPLSMPLLFGDSLSPLYLRTATIAESSVDGLPKGVKWSIEEAPSIDPRDSHGECARQVYLRLIDWAPLWNAAEKRLGRECKGYDRLYGDDGSDDDNVSSTDSDGNDSTDTLCCVRPVPVIEKPLKHCNNAECAFCNIYYPVVQDEDKNEEQEEVVVVAAAAAAAGGAKQTDDSSDESESNEDDDCYNCYFYVPPAEYEVDNRAISMPQKGVRGVTVMRSIYALPPCLTKQCCKELRDDRPLLQATITVHIKVQCGASCNEAYTSKPEPSFSYEPRHWVRARAVTPCVDVFGTLPCQVIGQALWLGKLERGTTLTLDFDSLVEAPSNFDPTCRLVYARAYVENGHYGTQWVYVAVQTPYRDYGGYYRGPHGERSFSLKLLQFTDPKEAGASAT